MRIVEKTVDRVSIIYVIKCDNCGCEFLRHGNQMTGVLTCPCDKSTTADLTKLKEEWEDRTMENA